MKLWKNMVLGAVTVGFVTGIGMMATSHEVNAASYSSELKKDGTLTVGLEGTYKPFSYRNTDGKLVGYDVAVAKAVAKKMGLKIQFVQTKFDSLVAGLDANKYDAVYNDMGTTSERKKNYTFGSQYLYTHGVMIVKKGSSLKQASELKGKKVAQTTSSNYGQEAKKLKANIVSTPGFTEGLDLIESGKADATLNSADAWGVYKKAHPKTKLKAIDASDVLPSSGAAPMFKKSNVKLAKAVSKAQKQLQKDGTLTKLSKQYFDSDLSHK